MKEKMDKKHAAERKAATDKQMALVKQMHIDQLVSRLCGDTRIDYAYWRR